MGYRLVETEEAADSSSERVEGAGELRGDETENFPEDDDRE